MKHILEIIKKHKVEAILFLICMAFLSFGAPLIINILFKHPSSSYLTAAEWDAGAALEYFGTVLTFWGTSALSIIALWQNKVIDESNSKHSQLIEKMLIEKNMPLLYIVDISYFESFGGIIFSILNVSDNIANNITISNVRIIDSNNNIELWKKTEKICIHHLIGTMKETVRVANPEINGEDISIIMDISYQDKFGVSHYCEINGYLSKENTRPTLKICEKRIHRKEVVYECT